MGAKRVHIHLPNESGPARGSIYGICARNCGGSQGCRLILIHGAAVCTDPVKRQDADTDIWPGGTKPSNMKYLAILYRRIAERSRRADGLAGDDRMVLTQGIGGDNKVFVLSNGVECNIVGCLTNR